jgi:hypothetical protein
MTSIKKKLTFLAKIIFNSISKPKSLSIRTSKIGRRFNLFILVLRLMDMVACKTSLNN